MNPNKDWFYNSEEFQEFFKTSHRSTIIKANSPRFTIVAVSDNYLQMTHRKREDLLRRDFFDIFPGNAVAAAQKDSLWQSFQRVITSKVADVLPVYEYQIFLPDKGQYLTQYWSNTNEPVFDTDGNVTHIIRTVINVTDKVTSEYAIQEADKLKTSLQREQSLNEELASAIEELRAVNEELHQSQTNLYNLTNELEARVASRTQELTEKEDNLRLANETTNRLNRELININHKLAASNEELGAANEEQSAINEELQQAQNDYLEIYDALSKNQEDLVFVIDAAGLATFDFNPNTGRFAGNDLLKQWFGLLPEHEIELHKATDVIAETDRKRVVAAIQKALTFKSGGNYDIEYTISSLFHPVSRMVRAQGKTRFDENRQAIRLSGILQDITEQKKEEQRKNDFIGMVSHEMKTPLTSLSGYIQLVQAKTGEEDVFTKNMLGKADKQISRMTTLINGFLNVSRLESGQIQIDKQRFDMAVLIKESAEEVSMYNTHRIRFAPVEETFVYADKDKIGQVIDNLISNAVKYSPANSLINVACITRDGMAVVSVRDEGIGIKEEDQPKLFERYYRVDNDNTSSVSGFGIGLYLCAEIIRRHDGKIWVESEVGKGSTFLFTLPVSQDN